MLRIAQTVLIVMLLTSASITNGQEWKTCTDPGWLCGKNFVMQIGNTKSTLPRAVTVKCLFPARGLLKKTGDALYELPVRIMFQPALPRIPNNLFVKMEIRKEKQEDDYPYRYLYRGTIRYGDWFRSTPSNKPGFFFQFGIPTDHDIASLSAFGFSSSESIRRFHKQEVFD